MIFDSEQINEFVKDLFKVGEVTSVNAETCTASVVFDDEDGFVCDDMQVMQKNTLENSDVWLPDVGEDVLCLFIPGGEEDGFILGSFYADEITPPQEFNGHNRVIKFKDETILEYDWEAHKLRAQIGDTEILADEKNVKITGAKEINFDVPKLIFNGDLFVKGNLDVDGDAAAKGEVMAKKGTLNNKLSTHIHPTKTGPTSAPTPNT